jgi:thiol-disulfide isomerase/thioredoxin
MVMSVELTLYHAEWCGHCVTFKPEWEKIKKYIKEAGNKCNGVEIKVNEYEYEQIEKMGGVKINDDEITGYPTLKLKLSSNDVSKEYNLMEHAEERTAKYIVTFIKNVCDGLKKQKK